MTSHLSRNKKKKKEREEVTRGGGDGNKGENATEEHRCETHPSSAPSVEEKGEQNSGRKFREGG